jgi:Asp/Glu/hydantoin racemase
MTQPPPGAQQMSMDSARAARPLRIALFNPNTNLRTTELMLASAWAVAPPDVHIEGRTAAEGQTFIADPQALQQAADHVLANAPALMAEGFDALIVAGFGDPGVLGLRQRLKQPITGLGEAGIAEAAAGGLRYAIVTVTPALHDSLVAAAHAAAPAAQFAGVRYTRGDASTLMQHPAQLQQALLLACQEAVEQDGVRAIVIGGGPLAHAAQDIAQQLQLRVVDPVSAAVRLACARVRL